MGRDSWLRWGGGQELNLDFLPSKGLLGAMKPNRVTEQLWQRWEKRQGGRAKKPAWGRLEKEGVHGACQLIRIEVNLSYSEVYIEERSQKQKLV